MNNRLLNHMAIIVAPDPNHPLVIIQKDSFWNGQLFAALIGATIAGFLTFLVTVVLKKMGTTADERIRLYLDLVPGATNNEMLNDDNQRANHFDRMFRTAHIAGKRELKHLQPVEDARKAVLEAVWESRAASIKLRLYTGNGNIAPDDPEYIRLNAGNENAGARVEDAKTKLKDEVRKYENALRKRI